MATGENKSERMTVNCDRGQDQNKTDNMEAGIRAMGDRVEIIRGSGARNIH